jgi:hypothetical protein
VNQIQIQTQHENNWVLHTRQPRVALIGWPSLSPHPWITKQSHRIILSATKILQCSERERNSTNTHLSAINVVFVFNPWLNEATPESPMLVLRRLWQRTNFIERNTNTHGQSYRGYRQSRMHWIVMSASHRWVVQLLQLRNLDVCCHAWSQHQHHQTIEGSSNTGTMHDRIHVRTWAPWVPYWFSTYLWVIWPQHHWLYCLQACEKKNNRIMRNSIG